MNISKGSSFKMMGAEVFLLGVIVFLSLGLGAGRSVISAYASEISVRVWWISINLEYTIIGAALIVVGYEILSFSRKQLVPTK